jgi:hypothetical protein
MYTIGSLFAGIYTVFWNEILQRVNATNHSLQDAKLDVNTAIASLTSLKDFISSRRDCFDEYERQGKELSGSTKYADTETRNRRRNVRLDPLDYGRAESAQRTPSQKYRTGKII